MTRPFSVWGIDGRFHEPEEIRRRPVLAAAANWLALATAAARLAPDASRNADRYRLDHDRHDSARQGQGRRSGPDRHRATADRRARLRRDPAHAALRLATELPFRQGQPIGLAAELFATTLDVFLTLGDLEEDPTDLATADGRGATVDAARDRLARMVGADRESFSAEDALELSRSAAECLLQQAVPGRSSSLPGDNRQGRCRRRRRLRRIPGAAVGGDEFSGRIVAIISLAETWGCAASAAACARALLTLIM